MTVVVNTSGRLYDDFLLLRFLHDHRESSVLSGELRNLISFVFFVLRVRLTWWTLLVWFWPNGHEFLYSPRLIYTVLHISTSFHALSSLTPAVLTPSLPYLSLYLLWYKMNQNGYWRGWKVPLNPDSDRSEYIRSGPLLCAVDVDDWRRDLFHRIFLSCDPDNEVLIKVLENEPPWTRGWGTRRWGTRCELAWDSIWKRGDVDPSGWPGLGLRKQGFNQNSC